MSVLVSFLQVSSTLSLIAKSPLLVLGVKFKFNAVSNSNDQHSSVCQLMSPDPSHISFSCEGHGYARRALWVAIKE